MYTLSDINTSKNPAKCCTVRAFRNDNNRY